MQTTKHENFNCCLAANYNCSIILHNKKEIFLLKVVQLVSIQPSTAQAANKGFYIQSHNFSAIINYKLFFMNKKKFTSTCVCVCLVCFVYLF